MFTGFILLLISALLWVIGSVVIRKALQERLNVVFICGFTAAACWVCCLPLLVFTSATPCPMDIHLTVIVSLLAAGALSMVSLYFINRAHRSGKPGPVWHLAHVVFIMPFLMGVIFFGDAMTYGRTAGVILLAAAVMMLGSPLPGQSRPKGQIDEHWKRFAIGGILCGGLSQCAFLIPSYLSEASSIGSILRTFYYCTGGMGAMVFLAVRKPSLLESRKCFIPSLIVILVVLLCCTLFVFRGLNSLAAAGAGALGFPFGIGCCALAIYLYSRYCLKNKVTAVQAIGFFTGLTGLLLCLL